MHGRGTQLGGAALTTAVALAAAVTGCSAASGSPSSPVTTTVTVPPSAPAPSTSAPATRQPGGSSAPLAPRLVVDAPLHLSGTEGSLSYDVEVPRFTGTPAAGEVNRRVLASAEHALDAVRDSVLAGDPPRTFEGDGAVTTNDGRTVQVHYVFTDFTEGTAHPTSSVSTVALASRDGSPLTLDEVFADEGAALRALAVEVRRVAAARDEPVEESGLEPVRENWAAWQTTAEGMVVSFQDFQLGGHGLRDYTVGWDVLEPLVSPSAYALLGPVTGV